MANHPNRSKRRYFVLIRREGASPWGVEFGDYALGTVIDEQRECAKAASRASALAVLRTTDAQADIDAAVARLNQRAQEG